MRYDIKCLELHELRETIGLVKNVFDEFEAPYYTDEGVKNFYKFANYNNIANKLNDNMKIFVAKENDKIIGMIGVKNFSHIAMLFVDKNYHKRGIGKDLVNKAKSYCRNNSKIESITVNSSPYAVEFYHKIGFKDTGMKQTVDEIMFVPMKIEIYRFEEYHDKYFQHLYEIKRENFKWYVEKIYGWDELKQIKFYEEFVKENRKNIKIIKFNGEIIGVFTNFIDENNESFISLFYIDKKYQGKGIGTEILEEQLDYDRLHNRNTLLQVFKENPARFLYQKLGFKVYAETATHYKMKRDYKL